MRFSTTLDVDSKSQLDTEINDAVDVDDETLSDQHLEEIITALAIDTTNADSSDETLLDAGDIGDVGNQVELKEEIDDILRAGGAMSRDGSGSRRGRRRVTNGRSGNSRCASVREAAALSVADSVGCGADALRRVVPVVGNEPVLAAEVARLADVADGLAVFRVVALLIARLAVDQVGEEVMGLIFTTEQVGNVLSNRVGPAEIGEDRQAKAEVKVTSDQRLVARENVEKIHVEIKTDTDVD